MTSPTQHRLHWTYERRTHAPVWYGRLAYEQPPVCWIQRIDCDAWMLLHVTGGSRLPARRADDAKRAAELIMFGG